ncbi:MAG: hypothetical protein LBL84_02030 [Candidatus Nomurabacteria bacterium]|jgi:polyferredoxin|nr:hypothetical protein [Candidatus Nomurabacteria bacterium]
MNNEKTSRSKGDMGAAALTLGIISIASAFFWYLTIPTGILAIVLGARSSHGEAKSKTGRAGMILGIVGLAIFLVIYASMLLLLLLANYN